MPVSPKSLVSILEENKNKKLAATRILEANPKSVPVVSKLIRTPDSGRSIERDRTFVNKQSIMKIYKKLNTQNQSNEYVTKLFPDIELAIQILVSTILSPKKMTDTQLNYSFSTEMSMDAVVSSKLLKTLSDYLNLEYKLEEKLPDIIREALFETGAYVTAIIPESSVDEVINSDIIPTFSTESFKANVDTVIKKCTSGINILHQVGHAFPAEIKTPLHFVKSIASEEYLRITDNPDIFKLAKVKDKLRSKIIKSALKKGQAISTESLDNLNYIDIFRGRNNSSADKDVEFIKTSKETTRKSLGKPMVMKLPTAAVIPVFVPGDPSNHVGYFVLLDGNGTPLEINVNESDEQYMFNFFETSENTQFNLTKKSYNNLVESVTKGIDTAELFDLYRDVVEKQLYTSIKNSIYGSNVDVANKNDVYFLMFTRALKEQHTSLLFIPKELVTYYAFYYNELGIGKTLLENITILCSLRSILLFSKVMAYTKEAIDITKVNISLDPNDPDPEKTIEQIQDSVLKLRQNYFPLGINNPVDLVDWIQRAGLQFAYENNPLLPDVKIDFENVNLEHTIPNSELEEELRKQTIIALGLSPEVIDNGFTPEFATSVVNNNILLSKRVMVYQTKLLGHVKSFVEMVVNNDEDLRTKLKTIVYDHITDITIHLNEKEKVQLNEDKVAFVNNYIDTIVEKLDIKLPTPDNTNLENLASDYDLYKENLDKVIDTVISTDMFTSDIAGDVSSQIDSVKSIYKNYLLRKWMADNNFYPEVLQYASSDNDESNAMSDTLKSHLVNVMKNTDLLIKSMGKFKLASNADKEETDI
jgi:hypothetical protein